MIYLDFHAAAPVTDVAKRAMENFDGWANPSSVHRAGRESRRALENAREQVAASLGASSEQIVFTAGGTEACNLAILGMPETPTRIIT